MDNMKRSRNYFIYFAAVSLSFVCFSTGLAYAWTSPLVPKFESNDTTINPTGRPITLSESGLLLSLLNLGVLFGPFVTGLIVTRLGKKTTTLLSTLPMLIAHVMCSFATNLYVFFVARFLMGFTCGSAWALLPGYLSEISEPENRGLLNSFLLVFTSVGNLFAYLIGPFVSVTWFSLINVIPVVVDLVLVFWFIPESPYDLITKKKYEEAERCLKKLRQQMDVKKDLMEIERIIENTTKNMVRFRDIFYNRSIVKALLLCGALMSFNAMSGGLIVFGYTQTIVELVGTFLPSAQTAIVAASISIMGTIVNLLLIDRLGRKPLLLTSSFFSCVAQTGLSTFFHLQGNNVNVDSIKFIPIGSVMLFVFFHYLGLGSLPWIIVGEIFPPNVKALAATVCTSINYLLAFIVTFVYPYLVESIGIANAFLCFGGALATCFVFCLIKLPETNGKTFEEIFELLNQNK